MSKKVKFYEIKIYDRKTHQNLNVAAILRELEQQRLHGNGKDYVHDVSGKKVTFFRFIQSPESESFVIPFGSVKAGAVYKGNENDDANEIPTDIEEVTEQLFDISSFYYSTEEGIVLICCDRSSPSVKNISGYLTKALDFMRHSEHEVTISQIVYYSGIERIRNANVVNSIILTLDLSETIENIYTNDADIKTNYLSVVRNIAQASKDHMNAKTFKLEIGIGQGSRKVGLSINNALNMLSELNLDTDAIKEVTVKYKNGEETPVSTARLKESMLDVSYEYTGSTPASIGPVYLSMHADLALEGKRNEYRTFLRNRAN